MEARCDQPGAELTIDGKRAFRGPGEALHVVLPGEHVITARKSGYFPVTRTIMLSAGARGVVTLSMSVDGIIEKHRWKRWMPWAVIGSGVVVGVVGAGLEWPAGRQLDQARRDLTRECGSALSCAPATPSSYGRALWEHRIGTGAMVVGSTVAAAGLALMLLNQPRAYRTENRDSGTFELMPIVSPDTAGMSAQFRF